MRRLFPELHGRPGVSPSRADGTLADYASLRDIPYGGSYGRMAGENGWFYFAAPPRAGEPRRLPPGLRPPEAAEPDGVFNGVESVTVTLSGRGEIYYTTDGSYPTADSPFYTGPITWRRPASSGPSA